MKTCTKCRETFVLECFHKSSKTKDGLSPQCKECHQEYSRKWRAANPKPAREVPLSKLCSICQVLKPSDDYYKEARVIDGLQPYCKACARKRNIEWRRLHPEREAIYARRHRLKDIEHARAQARKYAAVARPRKRRNCRAKILAESAKRRCKKLGIPYDLDVPALQKRIDNGVCEVTGIPFDMETKNAWNVPSIDQIIPRGGYTMNNVRLILWGLNRMMSNWGTDKVLFIADAIRRNQYEG